MDAFFNRGQRPWNLIQKRKKQRKKSKKAGKEAKKRTKLEEAKKTGKLRSVSAWCLRVSCACMCAVPGVGVMYLRQACDSVWHCCTLHDFMMLWPGLYRDCYYSGTTDATPAGPALCPPTPTHPHPPTHNPPTHLQRTTSWYSITRHYVCTAALVFAIYRVPPLNLLTVLLIVFCVCLR